MLAEQKSSRLKSAKRVTYRTRRAMNLAAAVDAASNPTLHRIAASAASPHFKLDAHYRIAAREPGAVRRD